MSGQENAGKRLNTLVAIVCVALIAFVTIFAVGTFELNGETLKILVALAIIAVAGLGGYEIREQFKERKPI